MTSILAVLAVFVGVAGYGRLSAIPTYATSPPFTNWALYVNWVQTNHKAPFDRDSVALSTKPGFSVLRAMRRAAPEAAVSGAGTNIKVNQDLNPWPKNEVAAAVDPVTGKTYVVMTNDFRANWNHMFYHVSMNGGTTWIDDAMATGTDFQGAFTPYGFQSDPGVAFDGAGHSFISNISGNQFSSFSSFNFDTEIDLAQGFANGSYTHIIPAVVDFQPCSADFATGIFNCPATLDKPLVTVDNVAGSPHEGAVYVYYTLFCNGVPAPVPSPTPSPGPTKAGGGGGGGGGGGLLPCTDGTAVVPPFSSAILESHQDGAGLPFSPPALVSGSLPQEQFSDMIVDSLGIPHIFFDDFSGVARKAGGGGGGGGVPPIRMFESTLTGAGWAVGANPVATFQYTSLNNVNWSFRDFGSVAPGCAIHANTAYCAFSANSVGSGKASSTPDVYLVSVNQETGASHTARVNNDTFNGSKDHFFAWASAAPNGAVYVGWYDNRKDPFNAKVEYFIGKSTDGGKKFPIQKAVSDTSFNPCNGFPSCSFFGDYTQLITGPDGVTRAAWTDTRDGASQQIWSQAITW